MPSSLTLTKISKIQGYYSSSSIVFSLIFRKTLELCCDNLIYYFISSDSELSTTIEFYIFFVEMLINE